MRNLNPEILRESRQRAHQACSRLRLSLSGRHRHGTVGSHLGPGSGTSLEFHDHRPYYLGDDPKNIDWRAYARSGSYTLKVYRAEVAPHIDIVFDSSDSMGLTQQKARRSLELLYFVIESAARARASVRCMLLQGSQIDVVQPNDFASRLLSPDPHRNAREEIPDLTSCSFRFHSIRLLISDLLFQGDPATLISTLMRGSGNAAVIAPYALEEQAPQWQGMNLIIEDCETLERRQQYVSPEIFRKYQATYRQHFELWSQHCTRHSLPLLRVHCEASLSEALLDASGSSPGNIGVLEVCS